MQDVSVSDTSQVDSGPAEPDVEPTMPELAEGWTQIEPGGDTICSRGTKYFFMVRKGSVNKVVIDFMGGGAC